MLYTGGCHCGQVRFTVDLNLEQAIECNCSICSKRGTLLAFVPDSHFTLLTGEESLVDYQFNKFVIHHLFCKVCGVAAFGSGSDQNGNVMKAINVRCLDEVDLSTVPIVKYDGKSL